MLAVLIIFAVFFSLSSFDTQSSSHAPTPVEGQEIDVDTTWISDNSPYWILGDVYVAAGVTLTIEPGVSVLFEDDTGLIINGSLIAIGDSTSFLRTNYWSRTSPSTRTIRTGTALAIGTSTIATMASL